MQKEQFTMNILSQLEGLKFPDEMVTRFFFKNGFHNKTGRVLELGCGNANNLSLFAAYGWECIGLDMATHLITQGKRNFELQGYPPARLEVKDMNDPLPDFGTIDVLLMPGSIYYIHFLRAREVIQQFGPSIRAGGYVFCRFRTPEDYRFGKGTNLGCNSFRLNLKETSEYNCINAFYDVQSMLNLLEPCSIDLNKISVMKLFFDNLGLEGKMIDNKEMVLWGQTNI